MGHNAASSGNFLPMFPNNPLVHLQSQESANFLPLKMGPIGYPETSVRNYLYLLYNGPEECSSHLLRGGSLKSRIAPDPVCVCFVVQRQFWRIRCVHYIVTDKWKLDISMTVHHELIIYQLPTRYINYYLFIKLMSFYMFRTLNAHLQEDTVYTCSIWYCHSLREFVVACRCTLCTGRPPRTLVESDSTICCMYTV